MLHNSGIRETRSDVCRSNNLPGYYIKRERSVRYILLEITRAHERIHTHSLNYGNCWLVNCSLRCPLGDCTETRTFTWCTFVPQRGHEWKKISRWKLLFEIRVTFGEVKKKKKYENEPTPSTQRFPLCYRTRKESLFPGQAYFFYYRHRDFFVARIRSKRRFNSCLISDEKVRRQQRRSIEIEIRPNIGENQASLANHGVWNDWISGRLISPRD